MTPGESFFVMMLCLAGGVSVAMIAYTLIRTVQTGREEMRRLNVSRAAVASPLFRPIRMLARVLGLTLAFLSARLEMLSGRSAERSYLVPVRLWWAKRLRAAGHPQQMTPDELNGLTILSAIFGTLVGVLIVTRVQIGLIIPFFTIAGAGLPSYWLRSKIRSRQQALRAELPYALDLLTLSVEAGLDFTQALARIVRKLGDTPLAAELGATLRDIQLGRTRAQALRDLSNRVDLPDLNSIVSSLIQADQLGTSLGPILRVQANQLRERRSQYAEKLAMEAPVKILMPLILCIFPCIVIMIFGPIVLKFL